MSDNSAPVTTKWKDGVLDVWFCRWFWHRFRPMLNEHGALRWLVCERCGYRRDLIYDHEDGDS